MLPYSRGKRMLEMSLQCTQTKRQKEGQTSDRHDVPQDADLSFSFSESLSNLPDVSSSLNVANFILSNSNEFDYSVKHCDPKLLTNHYLESIEMCPNNETNTEHVLVEKPPRADYNAWPADSHEMEEQDETSQTCRVNDFVEVENRTERDINDVETGNVQDARETPGLSTKDGHECSTDTGVNEEENMVNEREEIEVQRVKKTKRKTKKQEKKENRQHGKSYIGRSFDKQTGKFVDVMKEEKTLGERCQCKAAYYKCKDITDDDRRKIFSDVWNMSWSEKEIFVNMAVEAKDVKERKGNGEHSRRNRSLVFTLRGSSAIYRVCKDMFLGTTGLKSWWVVKTVSSKTNKEMSVSSESADKDLTTAPSQGKSKTSPSEGRLFLKEFFNMLPKMPAHYCRKDTSKLYLEATFTSFADVYKEYSKRCTTEGKQKMSMTVFTEELKAANISIFTPRKDQCDLCCEYMQGNTSEEVYRDHRARKEAAQAEKTKDKTEHVGSRTKVLCMDVQRVLLSPCLKASALYYKTKLQVHNYTVYDLCNKDVTCFVWNETEGGLSANEFASCLFVHLERQKDLFDRVIIYSDGCTYQNRNRMMATALRYFSTKYAKVVEQKILERGHTQMEVDSVHATIERGLKNVDIFSPLDYVQLIQAARKNPKPYEVEYLNYDFYLDFEHFGDGAVKSLKPGKDANVNNICALQYNPDGFICYKLNFGDEWKQLGRTNKLPINAPSQLYHSRRKIKKTKYDHLQSLKPVLPADVHGFYDALPHT